MVVARSDNSRDGSDSCTEVGGPPLRGLRRGQCCRRPGARASPSPPPTAPRPGAAGWVRARRRPRSSRPPPSSRSSTAPTSGPGSTSRPSRSSPRSSAAPTASSGSASATSTAASSSPTTARDLGRRPRTRRSRPPRARSRPSSPALNSDANDTGPVGAQVVEVYRPLVAGPNGTQVGVLEIYLPYAADPRRHRAGACTASTSTSRVGLGALYVILAVCASRRPAGCVSTRRPTPTSRSTTSSPACPNRRMFPRRVAELTDSRVRRIRGRRADRPRPVQGRQRHARPPQRRPAAASSSRERLLDAVARRRHGRPARRRRVRRDPRPGRSARTRRPSRCDRLLAALGEPLDVAGLPLTSEASIGFALMPRRRRGPRRAAAARATWRCTWPRSATPASSATTRRRTTTTPTDSAWSAELRRAIDAATSSSCTTSRRSTSATGRSRPSRRWSAGSTRRTALLLPDAFLPVAEQTGLIDAAHRLGRSTPRSARPAAWAGPGLARRRGQRLGPQPRPTASFADAVLAALSRRRGSRRPR